MNRRRFLRKALATGSAALLAERGYAGPTLAGPILAGRVWSESGDASQEKIPGAVPPSAIDQARFPPDFLWGMASAA
jgi:hypothetical protein